MTSCGLKRTFKQSTILSLPRDDWQTCALSLGFVTNSDIPTSQSVLKQSYTEDTNGQNNDDKTKKPTFGSHSIFVNYCNILAYFCITHNKFKAT